MTDHVGSNSGKDAFRITLEVAIRIGLVLLVLWWCLQIFAPFVGIIVWSIIIAVAVFPMYRKLASALGGKSGLAAVLFTLVAVSILVVPSIILFESFVDTSKAITTGLKEGTLSVAPPPENVSEWPVIGKPVYKTWQSASTNLSATIARYKTELGDFAGKILSAVGGAGFGILQFTISIIIAGVFLAKAEGLRKTSVTMFSRVIGDRGESFVDISKSTIRSVAQGVLGVAVAQTILCAIGMAVAGVPGVGLWSALILVMAVAQLPPLIVMGPIILYMFPQMSTGGGVVFAIYGVIAAESDIVLKPIFLGRGTKSPMLVILIGAIGGMIAMGIVGLFLGAVVFAIGYELFIEWLKEGQGVPSDAAATDAAAKT